MPELDWSITLPEVSIGHCAEAPPTQQYGASYCQLSGRIRIRQQLILISLLMREAGEFCGTREAAQIDASRYGDADYTLVGKRCRFGGLQLPVCLVTCSCLSPCLHSSRRWSGTVASTQKASYCGLD